MGEPCNNYRVDTEAAEFGTCKCGFPKSAHQAAKEDPAAKALQKLKSKAPDDEAQKEPAPCGRYRVDTSAAEFGTCKCGWSKRDHEEKQEDFAARELRRLQAKSVRKDPDTKWTEPCNNFRVDTSAEEFGTCVCGFKKKDHEEQEENFASVALKTLKRKAAEKEEVMVKQDEMQMTAGSSSAGKKSGGCCVIS